MSINTDPLAYSRLVNGTGDAWPAPSWTCNCACSICLQGACCMDPNRPSLPTLTTTTTSPMWVSHEHDYRRFDRRRLFCRTCGDTKAVR